MISLSFFLKIEPANGNIAPKKIVGINKTAKLVAKVPNVETLGIISVKLVKTKKAYSAIKICKILNSNILFFILSNKKYINKDPNPRPNKKTLKTVAIE